MLKGRPFVLAAIAALCMAAIPATASQAGLVADLQLVDASDNGLIILFSMTNVSEEDLYVLSYNTPLRGIEADLFRVELDGASLPYMGILPYRIGPLPEDWILIGAGETVSAKVDLSSSYTMTSAGSYYIAYSANHQVYPASERYNLPTASLDNKLAEIAFQRPPMTIRSQAITFDLGANAVPAPQLPALELDDANLSKDSFYGCSSTSTLSSARAAGWYLGNAGYGCSFSCNSWYDYWFRNCSYRSTVNYNFLYTRNYCGDQWTFYCGSYAPYCQSNYLAYTYMGSPRRVYVCSAFYSYGGYWDKARVMFHEATHWRYIDDHCYGYHCYCSTPWDNADTYSYAGYVAYSSGC
jgi:hypothetical protein